MSTPKKPKFKLPAGYHDEQDFLADIRKMLADDLEADELNRRAQEEDHRFVAGDQWTDTARARRDRARKPVLTINRLPAFIGQIIGNRRMNETVIKIVPDNGGSKQEAKLREGLIRSIQKTSKADRAYDKALENCVIGGLGAFQVALRYADVDVFERDIAIEPIVNPLGVVFDRMSIDPTGRDARRAFVIDELDKATFEALYPWAQPADMPLDTRQLAHMEGWYTGFITRVVAYWQMRSEKRTIALLNSGVVKDVTELPPEEWLSEVAVGADGDPIMRQTDRPYCEMYLVSGRDVLEGPLRLPIKRVPVFRVPGWEIHDGSRRHRFGLVRWLKDPLRLHNYWRSVIAERLTMAPKARWVASVGAVQGREEQWRSAHLSDDPLLTYNDEATPPQYVAPPPVETSLLEQASATVQDIKDVSNMHEAALGQQGNLVSGKAINSYQRVSELGTMLYHDNLNAAIEECGEVINDLLPIVYDTPRVVKVLGAEDAAELVKVNDPDAPGLNDITSAKYAVSVTSGPSTVTKRAEAAEAMLNFINAAPQVMSVAADVIVEAQDWPGAEKIAQRLRAALPPQIAGEEDMDEAQMAAQQQAAEKAQQAEQIALAREQAAIMREEAQAALLAAQAELARAQAEATRVKASLEDDKLAADITRAEQEIELEYAKLTETVRNTQRQQERASNEHEV